LTAKTLLTIPEVGLMCFGTKEYLEGSFGDM
jgi:hypothetical protein